MAGVTRHIIGSFEEIGKDVVKQAAQAPVDIAQKVVESLGSSSGTKFSTQTNSGENKKQEGALGQIDKEKDAKVKKTIARAALEQLAGKKTLLKEPSIWEKLQKEEGEKKEQQKQQAAAAQQQALPQVKSKKPRGDLYGIKSKRASAEMSRNVRQD